MIRECLRVLWKCGPFKVFASRLKGRYRHKGSVKVSNSVTIIRCKVLGINYSSKPIPRLI